MQELVSKTNFTKELFKITKAGLAEDKAYNDITSDLTIKNNHKITFEINVREDVILCGVDAIKLCFDELRKSKKFQNAFLELKIKAKDGNFIKAGKSIAEGFGDAKLIFAAERVILNLLQHLSGISTLTNKFVKTLNNKKIKILDTRKTFPSLRLLQKYAVKIGGGSNHRFDLSDAILIKDNHIAAAGNVRKSLELAKKNKKLKIEIECDNLTQVAEAVKQKPDIIMLDNMTIAEIKKAIKIIRTYSKSRCDELDTLICENRRAAYIDIREHRKRSKSDLDSHHSRDFEQVLNKKSKIEVSGGINLEFIKKISKFDIDFISIGALTHSVRAVDIGLDVNTKK
ncbi:MAG: carboxylating nicotinate-nucleotide diphosphorylase [Rickettsiales bacterium]|nr:carboxylating nicotinate-nucleotide diphosphorylase [Rickettsiales bacterium]